MTSYPEIRGVDEAIGRLDAQREGPLKAMESVEIEATSGRTGRVEGVRRNVRAIDAEWGTAQREAAAHGTTHPTVGPTSARTPSRIFRSAAGACPGRDRGKRLFGLVLAVGIIGTLSPRRERMRDRRDVLGRGAADPGSGQWLTCGVVLQLRSTGKLRD